MTSHHSDQPNLRLGGPAGVGWVSVILPVMTETTSLVATLRILEALAAEEICEYLLVVSQHTSSASYAACVELVQADPGRLRMLKQTLPYLGGAMRDAFAAVRGTHTIMMASDLETDPHTVPLLIGESRRDPAAMVTASRWLDGGGFQSYQPLKLLANWLFQKSFALLYGVTLSDLTYGYRLFPTALIRKINWEELRHPFLLETLLKPLRLGIRVVEVPSRWRTRSEGESQNPFLRNFAYIPLALKLRFRSVSRLTLEA